MIVCWREREREERERWERREREIIFFLIFYFIGKGNLYYFNELYIKRKVGMLGELLDELLKR